MLSEKQRSNVAKILINMGTVAFATGVIGGALKTPFLAPEFIFGVATSAVCFLLAILIER